jgi:hypothetical protein
MSEAPADPPDPQRDLLEEMHYALRLADERERSAKKAMEGVKRQFAGQYSRLQERAKSAEKNADRAEAEAEEAERRVSRSLEALRLLRCRLVHCTPGDESTNMHDGIGGNDS